MTRINEIAEKQENPDAHKNKLKIDKQSSARIIKRSLWANASNKNRTSGTGGAGGSKSQVSEMINATLDAATHTGKRDLATDDNEQDDDDDDDDVKEKTKVQKEKTSHVDKRLKV